MLAALSRGRRNTKKAATATAIAEDDTAEDDDNPSEDEGSKAASDDGASTDEDVRVDDEDIIIRTPSPKQGSSRTSGAALRGRAAGNVFNIADDHFDAAVQAPVYPAVTGRVVIYESIAAAQAGDPAFSVKHNITTNLGPILKSVGDKHSPVRSEFSGGDQ